MKRKPDGSIHIRVLSNGTEVVRKKIDGKWVHQKKWKEQILILIDQEKDISVRNALMQYIQ